MRKYTYLIVSVIATGLIILVGEVLALKKSALGFWLILAILVASSAVATLIRWLCNRKEAKESSAEKKTWISVFGILGCFIEAMVFAFCTYEYLGYDEPVVGLLTFGAFVVLVAPVLVIIAITNIKESRR